MERIFPLELVGLESLDYSLQDEDGNVIYKKGDQLTPDMLLFLSYKKVYRGSVFQEENNQITNKGTIIKPVNNGLTNVAQERFKHKVQRFKDRLIKPTIIDDKISSVLSRTSRSILQDIYDNRPINPSICNNLKKVIVDEVCQKIECTENICQLRVYDDYMFSHSINVSTLSCAIGISLGLNELELQDLTVGAFLHDIGKMKVPLNILYKPGKLSREELGLIKNHSVYGYKILKDMGFSDKIARISLEHQERIDGSGYPRGIKGNNISLLSQIVGLADVYDALLSNKIYKKAKEPSEAVQVILEEEKNSFGHDIILNFMNLTVFN